MQELSSDSPRQRRSGLRGGLLTEIDVSVGYDRSVVNDEVISLLARHGGIYQRAGELVRIKFHSEKGRVIPRIEPIPEHSLTELISSLVTFRGNRGRMEVPPWCSCTIRARGAWPEIPIVQNIIEYPVMRPDGSILQKPGYDQRTQLYYSPSCEFEPVADEPNHNDMVAARERLLDLVVDFPFSQSVHRSAWLAGLLTFFARPAYEGTTPFFLVDANTRGAGKGFLCHVAALVATGRKMPVATQSTDEAAEQKFITAVARAGDLVKLIDNISRPFGTGKFDAALTTTLWEDRLLGQNQLLSLPLYTIWWGTGNNVQFHSKADTARRTLHIRLLSPDQNPEHRTDFKHPRLGQHILQHRAQLVADCLTLLRWHQIRKAVEPLNLKPWGSFEEWSELVRAAVVAAGLPDPIEAHEQLTQLADTSSHVLGDLVAGWAELCAANGVTGCTGRQAIEWLSEDSEWKARTPGHQLRFIRLRDALAELCPTNGRPLPDARQLGYALRSQRGRVIDGAYLETEGSTGKGSQGDRGGQLWMVKRRS